MASGKVRYLARGLTLGEVKYCSVKLCHHKTDIWDETSVAVVTKQVSDLGDSLQIMSWMFVMA